MIASTAFARFAVAPPVGALDGAAARGWRILE
jgi:hypothetical protein